MFHIDGFYKKSELELRNKLCVEKWSMDQLVLYDWYNYLQTEFISEFVLNETNITVTQEEAIQFKLEELESLKYLLEFEPTLCDICYQEIQGQ